MPPGGFVLFPRPSRDDDSMRSTAEKILSREQVAEICRKARGEGRKIGFTSGVFDLMHAGHADYTQKARAMCDILVAGVNTDASVRAYKGPGRPIVPERERAELVAALEAVDYVFLFSERRNAENIEAVRPDFYIKAGDYDKSELTSAGILERHGGRVILIPVENPVSTTEIIRRAAASLGGVDRVDGVDKVDRVDGAEEGEAPTVCMELPPPKMAPAVFLDRDGTINKEMGYLQDPAEFELLPNAPEGMKRFREMGYRIVVVTNQNGIGLGYFTRRDFYKVNSAMFRALRPHGVVIDRIYFCPHGFGEECDCRKPNTALLEQARKDLNLDVAHSIVIGDRTLDMELARRAGMTGILVKTGAGGGDKEFDAPPAYVAEDLLDAARWVLKRERGEQRA